MEDNLDYSQQRSYNLGIATEVSIEAAMMYDDLVFSQKVFGDGYFFRSDEQMIKRFPMLSKNTIRRHVEKLEAAGWISTKVKKVNGIPTRNYQIEQFLLPKMGKSKEIPKMGKSLLETTIPTTNPAKPSASLSTKKNELLILVNKVTGRAFRTLPERGVKKTLDAFSLEEISSALLALSRDEWHKERLKELSIDYFIRSTTIDKWLSSKPQAPLNPYLDENGVDRRSYE